MIRTLLASTLLWSASGCYLHHERSDDDRPADAAVDAGVDASWDGSSDASRDAPSDAGIDARTCEIVTLRPDPILSPVDIVWAIDSSMSMQDERDRLQATINDFARSVQQRVPDLHVVVITAENIVPAPLGTDPDSYLFVPQMIPSNDALSVLLSSFDAYSHFLRRDALLHLVVVSDDDSSLPADAFTLSASTLYNKAYTLHAIASPDINGGPCRNPLPSPLCVQTGIQAICGAAAIGSEYYRAAQATSGLTINVCLDDWTDVTGPLSDAVVGATPVPCRSMLPLHRNGGWPISVDAMWRPVGSTPQPIMSVLDSAECSDALGFYRESHEWSDFDNFVLCPGTCDEITRRGGEIDIRLDCADPL